MDSCGEPPWAPGCLDWIGGFTAARGCLQNSVVQKCQRSSQQHHSYLCYRTKHILTNIEWSSCWLHKKKPQHLWLECCSRQRFQQCCSSSEALIEHPVIQNQPANTYRLSLSVSHTMAVQFIANSIDSTENKWTRMFFIHFLYYIYKERRTRPHSTLQWKSLTRAGEQDETRAAAQLTNQRWGWRFGVLLFNCSLNCLPLSLSFVSGGYY